MQLEQNQFIGNTTLFLLISEVVSFMHVTQRIVNTISGDKTNIPAQGPSHLNRIGFSKRN